VTLVPFSRRVAADAAKLRAGKAGTSPPAAAAQAPAPDPAGPVPASRAIGVAACTNEELDALVSEAQDLLGRAGDNEVIRRDPYRLLIAGASVAVGLLPTMARRWDAAVDAVIAARHPMTPEERADLVQALVGATEKGAFEGTRKEAARMIRRLDHGLAVRMGLYVGGAFVAGSLLTLGALFLANAGPFRPDVEAGAAWRDLVQHNPDPRLALAAGEVRTDHNTGRRYYAGVSLWLDPSRPPPVTPPKPQGGQ